MKFRQFLDTCLDDDKKVLGKLGGLAKKSAPANEKPGDSPFAGDMKAPAEKKPAAPKVDEPKKDPEEKKEPEESKEEPKEKEEKKPEPKEEAPKEKKDDDEENKPKATGKKGGMAAKKNKEVTESFSLINSLLNRKSVNEGMMDKIKNLFHDVFTIGPGETFRRYQERLALNKSGVSIAYVVEAVIKYSDDKILESSLGMSIILCDHKYSTPKDLETKLNSNENKWKDKVGLLYVNKILNGRNLWAKGRTVTTSDFISDKISISQEDDYSLEYIRDNKSSFDVYKSYDEFMKAIREQE